MNAFFFRTARRTRYVLFVFLALAIPNRACSFPGPQTSAGGGQASQVSSDKSDIHVEVDLVSTPVVALDAKGEFVMNLNKTNIRVLDDNIIQTPVSFEIGGPPLAIVIVVEDSSRIEAFLPALRRTGVLFTQTVLGEDGIAAVVSCDEEIDKLLDFTEDHDAIDKTISALKPGRTGMRLYDAISEAVDMLRDTPSPRRKVIITLAEDIDTGSQQSFDYLLQKAQLANITFFSIGLSSVMAEARGPEKQATILRATPPGTYGLPSHPGLVATPTTDKLRGGNIDLGALAMSVARPAKSVMWKSPLEVATATTGGLYQSTVDDYSIDLAIQQMSGDLHAQYTLSYRPTATDGPGYHTIEVQVTERKPPKVRYRSGYYLSQPQPR